LIALAGAGLAVGFAHAGTAQPQAASTHRAAPKTTRITVTASEFTYVFSKRSIPAAGTVIFTVVNKGQISHNFAIGGKITPNLLPGKSAKITVKFKKKGRYPYLCTILGHAQLGMKGKFGVGVKVAKPPVPTTTTTTTTTQTTTTSTATVGNVASTVQVGMFEYRFELSTQSVPSGQVTFVITNKGKETHNFSINGVKAGTIIGPGATETYTVALPAGQYTYVCDVPFHADRGMTGAFTVTP
jgi:nitrite reductase (NO-forming)